MMKFKSRAIAFLISVMVTGQVTAQDNETVPQQTISPIAAMLDSLVTLNHVVRYNSLEANCYDPKDCTKPAPYFSDEVYEARINSITSPIPLSFNPYVKGFIDLYSNKKRGLTQRAMGLSNLYFPMFEEVLDREGLPLEFKYLSIVESALNPVAVSHMGATGLWQFMYSTGIIYDLKVNSYTDDRKDPYKATVAACQYFKDMYRIYNDWLLVIAAYNCGAGNVNKAIRRSGGKTNFWEIMNYLPAETRGYVPAFIAVTYVMNYSREHGLYPIAPAYSYFEVDTVKVDRQITFKALSEVLDLPEDVIAYLNPVYKKKLIPDGDNAYALRIPTQKISLFLGKQEEIYAMSQPAGKPVMQFASKNNDLVASADNADSGIKYKTVSKKVKKTHTVKRGETLSGIADRYDTNLAEIKKLNRLKSSHLKVGQKLQVYTVVNTKVPVENPVAVVPAKAADSSAKTASGKDTVANDMAAESGKPVASGQSEKGQKYIYHLVQPGDTLWNIARRYEGVTVEMIKDMNNLHNANIKPGTRLKVIVNG